VRSPANDDVLLKPRFAASLVRGAFDRAPDFTLPLVRDLGLTGDEPVGALMGLVEPATGRAEGKEGCLGMRDREAAEGTGRRDLEGEI
jgi:hypothetical protein